MKISVEISMYPLDANFIPPILAFIERLNGYDQVKVKTNSMSTQVFGEYDSVMAAINGAMRATFAEVPKVSMVMKFINTDLDYDYEPTENK